MMIIPKKQALRFRVVKTREVLKTNDYLKPKKGFAAITKERAWRGLGEVA